MRPRLVLASHNPGKLAELAPMLAPVGVAMISAAELGLPEPEESAPSFAGNAALKAVAAARASGLPALADDSGFCVAALGEAPGVFSARWAGAGRDFGAAMRRVLGELAPHVDRRARFCCALCLAWPDGEMAAFAGEVRGEVASAPRGAGGFGYDALFVPEGESRTYAEMRAEEKRAGSHRGRALAALLRALREAD